MDSVENIEEENDAERLSVRSEVQAGAYLLELSLDWMVLRASENIHHLLHHSHVTLIDEQLGRFVHGQALHDLRNLFSRLSGTTGIGRAYGIRLTDEPDLVDVSFQLSEGRVLLEAVPSIGNFGECFGSVGGLVMGLAAVHGQQLLDNAARRMRALTGYDRVILACGDLLAESSRGMFDTSATMNEDAPTILADTDGDSVPVFPRLREDGSIDHALLRACAPKACARLRDTGIRSALRIPFSIDGIEGEFRCYNLKPRRPNFELHAAAELFAQLFAMRLEIERLRGGRDHEPDASSPSLRASSRRGSPGPE